MWGIIVPCMIESAQNIVGESKKERRAKGASLAHGQFCADANKSGRYGASIRESKIVQLPPS